MCRRLFLVIILLVICLGIVAVWLATRHAAAPGIAVSRHYTRAQARIASARLEKALGLIREKPGRKEADAKAGGKPAARTAAQSGGTTTIRLNQDDINVILAANTTIQRKLAARGLRNAQVAVAPPNLVTVYANVPYHGGSAEVRISGALTAAPETGLSFAVRSVQIGDLPLGPFTNEKVSDRVGGLLQDAEPMLPLRVQQVSVEGKDLVLTGPPKKSARAQ